MTNKKPEVKMQKRKEFPSDEKINELAEWLEGLTIEQCMFLKDSYQAMVQEQASLIGNGHVH